MELGDANTRDVGGNFITNRVQLDAIDRELGSDHHRDRNIGTLEQRARRTDPRLDRGRAPHDIDSDLALLAGTARPRAEVELLDDLDEVPVKDPDHLITTLGFGHCNYCSVARVILSVVRRFCAALVLVLAVAPAHADDRCAQAPDLAKRGDLTRALVILDGCPDEDSATLARDLKKKARDADYAELSIVSDPAGQSFQVDGIPGETLTTPATIFVKAGSYRITYEVSGHAFEKLTETKPYSRSAVLLDAVVKPAGPTKNGSVNFEEENAGEQHSGPPPDVVRPSLMKDKYRGVTGPRTGPELEDPLALTAQHGAKPWFGLRVGGGLYDDSTTDAKLRPGVGVTARVPVIDRLFISARIDWSRRGGTAGDPVDAAGLNAGAGYTFLANRSLALAVIVQLRGELRFADTRDAMSVSRAGAGASTGFELAVGGTPLTAGLRFENSFTDLVPGTRDHAYLVELGIDWR